MAIYDNNGTTSYEIGKVYDHNGTTAAQIGQIYDNNGTTSTLLYTAEETLFPENLPFVVSANSSDSQVTASTLRAACNGTSKTYGNCRTEQLIDCSQYSRLRFTVSALTLRGNASAWCGVTDSIYAAFDTSYTACVQVTATGEVTLDLPSGTGSKYIAVSVFGSDFGPSMGDTVLASDVKRISVEEILNEDVI